MISEQLRDAIANSGETRYAISKATSVDQAVLAKFVNGKRGLSLETIDKLAKYLRLELRRADD